MKQGCYPFGTEIKLSVACPLTLASPREVEPWFPRNIAGHSISPSKICQSQRSESNRRPDAYEAPALPTELRWQILEGKLSYGDKGGRASVSVSLTIKRSLRERLAHN